MQTERGRVAPTQGPNAERRPRNICYVESRELARVRFPAAREALAQEFERRGLSRSQAARQGGVNLTVLQRWMDASHSPLAKTFKRFLGGLGIDPRQEPYASFLADQGEVIVVCPLCGKVRLMERGQLRGAATDAKGRRELRRRADGSYELPCRPCANRMKGLALKRRNEQRLRDQLGPKLYDSLVDEAKRGDLKAKETLRQARCHWMAETPEKKARRLARVRTALRRPRTEAYRRACAIGNVVARAAGLTRAFHLCPLCGRVTYAQRWHRPCWTTWRIWHQRKHGRIPQRGVLPPPLRAPGPNPEARLARNYRWLMARRDPKGRESRAQLLAPERKRKKTKEKEEETFKSRITVTEAIKAFIRLLPGSWDFVFSEGQHVRRTNIPRQELVPLPLEVQQLVGADGLDALIKHLLNFGMKEESVADLTGMGLLRVKGIAAGRRSARAASA